MKTKLTTFIAIGIIIGGFLCSEAQTWEWSESLLSYPRSGLSAAVLDDSIFYSGGRLDDNLNFSITVDVFDLGNGSWAIEDPWGPARWQSSSISANGLVFIAGGNNFPGSDLFTDVDIYSKENSEWTEGDLSVARVFMGVAANGNEVFFAGGMGYNTNSFFFYKVVDIYNTETGEWSEKELSSQRSLTAAAAAGNLVFFAGGVMESWQVTDVVDIYNIETGLWTEETLSEPRASIGAVACDNKVYFAGGSYANNTGSSIIDVYNVETSEWEEPLSLSEPGVVTALKVSDSDADALVFAGVCDYIDFSEGGFWAGERANVDIYDLESGTMDTVPALSPARVFYAYAAYEDKAYFAGGIANGEVFDIINILEYTAEIDGISEDNNYHETIQVHPNPVQSKFHVEYHLQHSQHVNLTLYKNTGEVIKVLSDGFRQQGDNRVYFNAESLNPGVYFIVLNTCMGSTTTKLIKL